MNKKYLGEIINLFVKKEKRGRFLEFVANERRYESFLIELINDPRNFDEDCITEISSKEFSMELVHDKLKELGAKQKYYIVSMRDEDDGAFLDFETIISKFGWGLEGIIYSPEAKAAYYDGHEGWHYILQKSQKSK